MNLLANVDIFVFLTQNKTENKDNRVSRLGSNYMKPCNDNPWKHDKNTLTSAPSVFSNSFWYNIRWLTYCTFKQKKKTNNGIRKKQLTKTSTLSNVWANFYHRASDIIRAPTLIEAHAILEFPHRRCMSEVKSEPHYPQSAQEDMYIQLEISLREWRLDRQANER